jgi:putative transcriptional regulator
MSSAKPAIPAEKGVFLIASQDMEPGIYSRSVILICEHTRAGSFGLVINKPFPTELPPEIIAVEELHNPKIQYRLGGRMQQNQMMLLHTSEENKEQTLKVTDGIYLGGDLNFLQESLSSKEAPEILLCFGYTGWISTELEHELAAGFWYTAPANKELVFTVPPEKVWRTALESLGDQYKSIAMMPDDLSLN